MNAKISQITSSALMATAVAGTLMGLVGQGILRENPLNIFYVFAALGILEIILQDYRIFPPNPAVNVPSTRKFYHEDIIAEGPSATSLLFPSALPKPKVQLVNDDASHPQTCQRELLGAA